MCLATSAAYAGNSSISQAQLVALDGHTVSLPSQLPGRATVLIIGFGRHSQDATTPWEKAVRLRLAHVPAVGFYDMAMLAEVPAFLRSFVIGRIREAVPDVLKPNFIPLTEDEDRWKRTAGFDPAFAEAPYVLLVDRAGGVRWSSHAAFTEAGFAELSRAAQQLSTETH